MTNSGKRVSKTDLQRMFGADIDIPDDSPLLKCTEDEIHRLMFSDAVEEFENGKAVITDDVDEWLDSVHKKHFDTKKD